MPRVLYRTGLQRRCRLARAFNRLRYRLPSRSEKPDAGGALSRIPRQGLSRVLGASEAEGRRLMIAAVSAVSLRRGDGNAESNPRMAVWIYDLAGQSLRKL